MIVVRNTFYLKFGKAKEAKAMMKEGLKLAKEGGLTDSRVLIDAAGRFYTMVLENSYDSFADFETRLPAMMKDERWQKWYQSFSELVESGQREIFTVVE